MKLIFVVYLIGVRFGNITMSLTAAAILQLYEAGKFNFDDPANNYLSNYKIVSNTPVTIKHLLTHTSGVLSFHFFFFLIVFS
jgi:CubicO group peptidase (beta-lactamase class C family)